MLGKCDRKVCLNADKVRAQAGYSLYINLALNGVQTVNRAYEGFTSAVHTKEDIAKTVEAFDISLGTMIEEKILG